MKKLFSCLAMAAVFSSCNTKTETPVAAADMPARSRDALTYAYKATYSSDITVPGDPVNAQKVLQVWKMFETIKIEEMKPYFADSVKYDDASGMHFYGPVEKLLSYAKTDIGGLDSMRFDIVMWQSAHVNDKNEDWVNIWSRERRYPKNGKKADTVLMQENWQVKAGKIVAFDQYLAKK